MPVELVMFSPHLQIAPGAVYRAVCSITMAAWASENPPETITEATAQQIGRIPVGNWNAIKTPVLAALADILPQLARKHAIAKASRARMRDVLSEAAKKGNSKRWISATQIANSKKPSNPTPLVTPAHAKPYHGEGKTMQSPQELAAIGKRPTTPIARMVDE
jgi:hypothetical protein